MPHDARYGKKKQFSESFCSHPTVNCSLHFLGSIVVQQFDKSIVSTMQLLQLFLSFLDLAGLSIPSFIPNPNNKFVNSHENNNCGNLDFAARNLKTYNQHSSF
jgi:hypothetical protein